MKYIKGKVRQLIYESDSGYKVGLFRVKETNDSDMEDFLNKTITFTGTFLNLNYDDNYQLFGEYVYHERFGHQYKVSNYQTILPTDTDALIEFLSSPLIKGCGHKTAVKIVDTLGVDALAKIKENPANLLLVPQLSEKKAGVIYESVIAYGHDDEVLIKLKTYGFSINEATTLLKVFGEKILELIKTNIYSLIKYIPFTKLDQIYLNSINDNEVIRIKACIIEVMNRISNNEGDTYYEIDTLVKQLKNYFNYDFTNEELKNYINPLINDSLIYNIDSSYYLAKYYQEEQQIACLMAKINLEKPSNTYLENYVHDIEDIHNVTYNEQQKSAITSSINNHVTLITGGPGTGKTTIINAICQIYITIHKLSSQEILSNIALLAPTGRAAKKISESTHLPAMTIHRYLKWNKDNNEFQVNEYNKNPHKLIIVDEMSMLDTSLFCSLLKGINSNITLILVGDPHQLPSVGPGNVLSDLINCHYFNHCPLTNIYRQTSNSYIPILAKEIRDHELDKDYLTLHDDYNFLAIPSLNIKKMLEQIIKKSLDKGLTEKDIQVLAPLYKGENGIDLLNYMLRNIFNPNKKNEIKIGDYIYKEGDKVLQLVNDPDNNVYNGDIGYINYIDKTKAEVSIDFEGNHVIYSREDMYNIKHAYVISIHKSQGSEFNHVILPMSLSYNKMLYNKLLYTAVSRAKKSIIIIGEESAFIKAINNDYSSKRLTSLISFLDVYFN